MAIDNVKFEEENKMQQSVLKVQELGVPPKGFEDNEAHDEDTIRIWDEWIEAVDSIQRPITWEEAEILIKCCPTEPMAEVEWTILHCIESVFKPEAEVMERYRNLIEKCNSDMMKDLLLLRLKNYIDSRK